MAVRRCKKEDLKRIARATGGRRTMLHAQCCMHLWLIGCMYVIGASLSEPHTSVTSLRRACVSMLACLLACLDLANTVI